MTRTPVQSSQIVAIGYDPATKQLEIEFKRFIRPNTPPEQVKPNSVYLYENITPEMHAALIGAESIGTYFGKFIKPFPIALPYKKIQ